MVTGISFKRVLNTLLVASLFLGLMFTLTTTHVDARKRVATMTSQQCGELAGSFNYFSNRAGEEYNKGNFEGSNHYTQLAAGVIAQARAGGCGWPDALFPDNATR